MDCAGWVMLEGFCWRLNADWVMLKGSFRRAHAEREKAKWDMMEWSC